ncbi:Pyr_redox_2 domain-containing protein [Gammaproteobacteria bacterium]
MAAKKMTKRVAIIGGGPAGMAAALQLHRFGIENILFEQGRTGSLLKNAWCVENYLGIYPGKSGIDLLQMFHRTLAKNEIKIVDAKVELLDYDFKFHLFKIKTFDKEYVVDCVIVASGTSPKTLTLIEKAKTKVEPYLFYEAFPLLKKRRKTIIIVGAGDVAFDNALNLAKHNKIIICNRSDNNGALPMLITQALKHTNITYYANSKLQSIALGTFKNLDCTFANRQKRIRLNADYLIATIGRMPQKDFYTDKLKLFEQQLIRSSKLFLIGDVKNNVYRQVAIAVGDGILAAMRIFDQLTK